MIPSPFFRLAAFRLRVRILWFLLASGLVVWASSRSSIPMWDSIWWAWFLQMCHAPLFGIWCLSLLFLLGPDALARTGKWAGSLIAVAAVGLFDEWNQGTQLGRASDLRDIVTDVIGGVGAILIARWANKTPLSWRSGVGLALVLFGILATWAWITFDANPIPLPSY